MEQQPVSAHDIFPHIRIVLGMVIGLGVTRLLSGLARIGPIPALFGASGLGCVGALDAGAFLVVGVRPVPDRDLDLRKVPVHHLYAVTLFLLCALLFPDSMLDYTSYEDFFYSRRAWFFGLLAATYLLDVIDTLLKGPEHFARFGVEYLFRTPVFVTLCVIAILVSDRRFHIAFVAAALVYQISFILRLFDTIV